jgi:hypothetical protein
MKNKPALESLEKESEMLSFEDQRAGRSYAVVILFIPHGKVARPGDQT